MEDCKSVTQNTDNNSIEIEYKSGKVKIAKEVIDEIKNKYQFQNDTTVSNSDELANNALMIFVNVYSQKNNFTKIDGSFEITLSDNKKIKINKTTATSSKNTVIMKFIESRTQEKK